jgi:cytochrome c-type biogenesis protein CcmE
MKRKQLKFVVGSMVIILTLAYLAYSGYQDSKSYFQTVPELYAMKDAAYGVRTQVSGDVVAGSIARSNDGKLVDFVIGQQPQTLKIRYVGKDPLPDTLIDRATAVASGSLGRDGVFTANQITAKCASKYEKEKAAGVNIATKE